MTAAALVVQHHLLRRAYESNETRSTLITMINMYKQNTDQFVENQHNWNKFETLHLFVTESLFIVVD